MRPVSSRYLRLLKSTALFFALVMPPVAWPASAQEPPVAASFVKPTAPCVVGQISGFGAEWLDKCSHGVWKLHAGADVDLQRDRDYLRRNPQRVWAAADGILKFARSYGSGWADAVVLEHIVPGIGRVTTLYGHLILAPGLSSRIGQRVNQGEILGTLSPDIRTTPHLHFGVRLQGYQGNPSLAGWLYGDDRIHQSPEVNRPRFPESWVDPLRFIAQLSNPLADGLYAPNNESGVFLVSGGVRRSFTSADCFNHWGLDWNSIKPVDQGVIYGQTEWEVPIPDLVTAPGKGIYWIVEGIARPIASGDIFNRMGFWWSDYRNISLDELNRYPQPGGIALNSVEPRLVVMDGPYVVKQNGYVSGGFRIRNLSQSTQPFDVTIRVYRSDGWWQDFPWHRASIGQNQEYVNWSDASFPSGRYTFAVRYSYWANGNGQWGNGTNIQYNAPVAGTMPYSREQGTFTIP